MGWVVVSTQRRPLKSSSDLDLTNLRASAKYPNKLFPNLCVTYLLMPSCVATPTLFPPLSHSTILAFQFSSWHPKFSKFSIKSTIIRPLGSDFREWIESDGVFIPEDPEESSVVSLFAAASCSAYLIRPRLSRHETLLSDDENDSESSDDSEIEETERRTYFFPELDMKIREAVTQYGAVFPKLNFSSPRVRCEAKPL